jgi:aspartate aminotransferase-like enzyme
MKPFIDPIKQEEFEKLRLAAAHLMGTKTRPLVIPGEAIWGIEAFARNVAAPGRVFLNVVTGPYGKLFGEWLREGGASVTDVETGYDEVVTADAVEEVIRRIHPCAIAFVHTEAITGGVNPARELLKLANKYELITIIDAVSSIGADEIYMDDWQIDFLAVGMQKALNGPNGISFMGISERGLSFVRTNPRALHGSILSLLDLYEEEEVQVPENLPVLEMRGALQAFEAIDREGLDGICKRHEQTAREVRRAVKALGFTLWQREENGCTNLNTTVCLPEWMDSASLPKSGLISRGNGDLEKQLFRINHYGSFANEKTAEQAAAILTEWMEAGK